MAATSRMMRVTSCRASNTNCRKVLGFFGGMELGPYSCFLLSMSSWFPSKPVEKYRRHTAQSDLGYNMSERALLHNYTSHFLILCGPNTQCLSFYSELIIVIMSLSIFDKVNLIRLMIMDLPSAGNLQGSNSAMDFYQISSCWWHFAALCQQEPMNWKCLQSAWKMVRVNELMIMSKMSKDWLDHRGHYSWRWDTGLTSGVELAQTTTLYFFLFHFNSTFTVPQASRCCSLCFGLSGL